MSTCFFIDIWTNPASPRHFLEVGHDLETGYGIQPTSRFIQEEDLGTGDQLTRNPNTTNLSTTETLANWSSNDRIRLVFQSEGGQ